MSKDIANAYEKSPLGQKYNSHKAKQYYHRYQKKWSRRIANYFDHRMALRALKMAGNPQQVLDLPCGTGRFWQKIKAHHPNLQLLGADYSWPMIAEGLNNRPDYVPESLFAASIFSLPLPDNSIENIFSMRFFHHIGHIEGQIAILQELYRVCQRSVCFSLYIDRGWMAKQWRRKHPPRKNEQIYNEYLAKAENIELLCRKVGFEITGYIDFCKPLSMWRTYVLKKPTNGITSASSKPCLPELVCPECKQTFSIKTSAEWLCKQDDLAFPIMQKVPVLIKDQARVLTD